ncbi:hypothetical protein ciss_07550 [Carboxydothermus islandicus]|uniref:Uncharacterized protein n=1 Tax=Carboxydothermus islandicus TaxID=661089 RepID=A0A1L8D0Y2_9THEO|nr:DUF4907 domain-containing protein [Carboxydothermus islandicus]GAV24822.1 hypothetical protein ciss_07550 [Carboxydothermus islandicus]
MQIEIFEIEGGFGYRIIDNERNIYIEQPFKPNVVGFQLMTKEEAEQIATEVVNELLKQIGATQ